MLNVTVTGATTTPARALWAVVLLVTTGCIFPARAGTVTIIDDGDAGYSAGGFASVAGDSRFYEADYGYAGPGAAITAQWSFTGLPTGLYRVSATWFPYHNRATDAPYSVISAGSTNTVLVNQQLAPDDFMDVAFFWEDIATNVFVSSGSLAVTVSGSSSGYVIADAIRLEHARIAAPTCSIWRAVGISWPSEAGVRYQVQWAPAMDTNAWSNLGAPVVGNGTTNSVADRLGDHDSRFYRVVIP